MAATFDPAFLFDKPTFCGTYFHAFKIIFAHWQTFMGLGLLPILVTAVILIIFGVIVVTVFASLTIAIVNNDTSGISSTDAPSDSYVGRFLLDRVLGITGASHVLVPHASRLLTNITYTSKHTTTDDFFNYDDNLDMGNMFELYYDTYFPFFIKIILPLFFLTTVLCLAATATFTGSLIRATAEAYAGVSPEFRSSLRYGWNAKWRITCFKILLFVGVFISSLVIVVLPLVLTENIIAFVLLAIAYVVIYAVMVCSMTGAMPSIVLENASATGAFKRSWDLCKSSTCEIFCKLVVFSFGIEVISSIIMGIFLSSDSIAGTIVGGIFSFLISGFHKVMMIVLSVVIYMGMRIEKEELTQVSFNQELSLPAPDNKVNDVEASNEPIVVKTGV